MQPNKEHRKRECPQAGGKSDRKSKPSSSNNQTYDLKWRWRITLKGSRWIFFSWTPGYIPGGEWKKKFFLIYTETSYSILNTCRGEPNSEYIKTHEESIRMVGSQHVIVPHSVMRKITEKEHNKTTISSLKNSVFSVRMTETAKSVTVKCPICLKSNPINQKRPPPVTTNREIHLEITAK